MAGGAMPNRAGRYCAAPGCGGRVAGRVRYCDEHKPAGRPELERKRASAARRGYGHRWGKLRRMVLNRHPLCANPHGHHPAGVAVVATQVDHITPLSRGGKNHLSNLQPLCAHCHSVKTAREFGAGGGGK